MSSLSDRLNALNRNGGRSVGTEQPGPAAGPTNGAPRPEQGSSAGSSGGAPPRLDLTERVKKSDRELEA
ncbi:MAG TPA: hypothetical protein VFO98_08880, partial [Marmoricola sp.]|nr:hypothetical protein [Marmoricola sp.]